MSGGTALNIVPDRAELELEYRHLAADDPVALQNSIQAVAHQAAAPFTLVFPAARIELEQVNAYPGLDVSETEEVVSLAKSLAATDMTTKVAFGTEAGYFASLGVPCVVCGPGSMEEQGHKPDESITLGQLQACDQMMDRVLNFLQM